MNISEFQTWLNAHGASLVVDGQAGPATRAAIKAVFVNKSAPAITPGEVANLATGLNIPAKNLGAVAKVESGGKGFDDEGRPKILYERHIFHRLTNGRYGVTSWSNPKWGGYNEDSWEKLAQAACRDPLAAFASVSLGKFQILGTHWNALGYPSSLEMAYSATRSEFEHYEMLVRFLRANHLEAAVRKLSTNPEDCRELAKKYNGGGYERNKYHVRLAQAMA